MTIGRAGCRIGRERESRIGEYGGAGSSGKDIAVAHANDAHVVIRRRDADGRDCHASDQGVLADNRHRIAAAGKHGGARAC